MDDPFRRQWPARRSDSRQGSWLAPEVPPLSHSRRLQRSTSSAELFEHPTGKSLLIWPLTVFHALSLLVLVLWLLHRDNALGEMLASIGTLVGIPALACLLATTRWTTRRTLDGMKDEDGNWPIGRALIQGAMGGAATGALFLLSLVAVALIPLLPYALLKSGPAALVELAGLASLLVVAAGIAYIVAAPIGLVYAVVDLTLARIAARIVYRIESYLLSDDGMNSQVPGGVD